MLKKQLFIFVTVRAKRQCLSWQRQMKTLRRFKRKKRNDEHDWILNVYEENSLRLDEFIYCYTTIVDFETEVDRTLQKNKQTRKRWKEREKKHENDDRSSEEMNIKTNFRNEQGCVQIKRHSRKFITYSGSSAMTNVHVFIHISSVEKKTFPNYLMGNNMTTHHPAIFFTLFISGSNIHTCNGSDLFLSCFVFFFIFHSFEKEKTESKSNHWKYIEMLLVAFFELNRRKEVKQAKKP